MPVTLEFKIDADFTSVLTHLDDIKEEIFQFFRALIYDSMMAQFGGNYEDEDSLDRDVLPEGVNYEEMKEKVVGGRNRQWPGLHEFTVARKRQRGFSFPELPLVATGRLQESIKSYVTGNFEAEIGTEVSQLASIIAEHEFGQRDPSRPISHDVLDYFGSVPDLPQRSIIIDLAETFFDSVDDEIGDIVMNIFNKYW